MNRLSSPILFLISLFSLSLEAQVAKRVFVEHFTNNSSFPAASQNPTFYSSVVDANIGTVVHISFHTAGGDIFNAADPIGVASRTNLYGSSNIPVTAMNGRIPDNQNTSGGAWLAYAGAPSGYTQTAITNEASLQSNISINASHTFNSSLTQVDVRVVIKNETSASINLGNHVLYNSIVLEELNYNTAPNANGEIYFRNIHRGFAPSENGETLSGSLPAGDSLVYTYQEAITNAFIDLRELKVISFVQNTNSNEVIQSGESAVQALSSVADLSLETVGQLKEDLCANSFSPTLLVRNSESGSISGVEIESFVNGASKGIENVSVTLNGNSSQQITLNSIDLDTGLNSVEFVIIGATGDAEVNTSNNALADDQVIVRNADLWTEIGFEDETIGSFPNTVLVTTSPSPRDDVLVFVANQSLTQSSNVPAGGFGTSDNSLAIDFFSASLVERTEVLLPEIPISIPENNAKLYFEYAHAQRNNSSDSILVQSSIDCGSSWNTIWSAGGSSLATTSESTVRFWPTSNTWDTTEIDVDFGSLVRFVGISNSGNTFYLDNIELRVALSVDQLNDKENNSIIAYPNPTKGNLTIQYAALGSLDIYDLSGRLVRSIQMTSPNQSIDISNLVDGTYLIRQEQSGQVERIIKK